MSGQDVPTAVFQQWAPLLVTWDLDGTVRSASESYAAQLGMALDDVLGRRWPDLVVGEEEMCWRQLQSSVDALQDTDLLVVDMPTRVAGRTEWFRWTETAVRDGAGRLAQVQSTGIQVTELYEARTALAEAIEDLAAARDLGRRDVLDQLHNGAVQQLTAARWAVAAGEQEDAARLIDDALAAVRASMESLHPLAEVPLRRRPPDDAFFRWAADQTGDGSLPAFIRGPLVDVVSDAVAVLSSTGSVWLDPDVGFDAFGSRTDVDIPSMLAVVHPDDRAAVAAGIVRALAGEPTRVWWRYRHRRDGWRRMCTWMTPLPTDGVGPRLAAALSLDITREGEDPVHGPMAARLDERAHLARLLHDDVLQRLAGLRWLMVERDDTDAVTEMDGLESSIRRQLQELDAPVARFGLEVALLHLLDETTTPTELRVAADARIPEAMGTMVWRCVREALRNVDRHAAATLAVVSVEVADGMVHVEVADDGRGVDERHLLAAARSGHLGVASMRESVAAAGGRLRLLQREGGGTVLRIEVPLP